MYKANAAEKAESNIIMINSDERREISPNMCIKTLMEKWLKYKKEYTKASTHANFSLNAENHINPYLGKMKIKDVHEGTIQDFVNHLYLHGRIDGKGGFGVRTIKDVILPLKMALDYAAKYKAIDKIEWNYVEFPKQHKTDTVKAMTYEEQRSFVQACYLELDNHSVAYLISLFTGLRIGEICGLQMKDISLEQKTISVNKTVQRIYNPKTKKTSLDIGRPKTENSFRTIPFPEKLIPVIKKFYRKDKPEYYFICGKSQKKPLEPRSLRQCFNRFLARNRLPCLKYHELRHTFATRAIEIPDFDIKSLSAILGHKNPAFTLAMYGRANFEHEEECMRLMNNLL